MPHWSSCTSSPPDPLPNSTAIKVLFIMQLLYCESLYRTCSLPDSFIPSSEAWDHTASRTAEQQCDLLIHFTKFTEVTDRAGIQTRRTLLEQSLQQEALNLHFPYTLKARFENTVYIVFGRNSGLFVEQVIFKLELLFSGFSSVMQSLFIYKDIFMILKCKSNSSWEKRENCMVLK